MDNKINGVEKPTFGRIELPYRPKNVPQSKSEVENIYDLPKINLIEELQARKSKFDEASRVSDGSENESRNIEKSKERTEERMKVDLNEKAKEDYGLEQHESLEEMEELKTEVKIKDALKNVNEKYEKENDERKKEVQFNIANQTLGTSDEESTDDNDVLNVNQNVFSAFSFNSRSNHLNSKNNRGFQDPTTVKNGNNSAEIDIYESDDTYKTMILPVLPPSSELEEDEEANKNKHDEHSDEGSGEGKNDAEDFIEYDEEFDENVGYCESDFDNSYSDSEEDDDFEPVNKEVSLDEIAENVPDYVDNDLVKFYMENFSMKVCKRFVLNPEDEEKVHCYCGYADSQHTSVNTGIIANSIFGKNQQFYEDKMIKNKLNDNNNDSVTESKGGNNINKTDTNMDTTKDQKLDNLLSMFSIGDESVASSKNNNDENKILETRKLLQKRTKPWNSIKDTKLYPTDAFGEIFFGTKTNSKYIRLDENTDMKKIIKLMTKMWKIEKPKLIISMKGGQENYNFEQKKRLIFWEGLAKTAVTANAWILTDGFNTGVSKDVGDSLDHYYSRYGKKNVISCIGMTPFGCVIQRENLVNHTGYGSWPVSYSVSPGTTKESEYQINQNHSHFLFVDNGTQHMKNYYRDLRSELERQLSALDASRNSNSLVLPIVTIVLEGNLDTLYEISKDVDCCIPVIFIAGSGGITDILVFAYSNCFITEVKTKNNLNKTESKFVSIHQQETFTKVEEMICKLYNCTDAKQHSDTVRKIIERAALLTVFRVEDLSTQGDLDIVLLKAILKTKQMKRIEQLKLALLLNRVDVAREEIYTPDAEFETEDLNDLLFRALLEDNTGFVKLLLEKGINLNNFLSVKRLLQLYNHPLTLKRNKELYKIGKKSGLISLKHVGLLIYRMTKEKIRHIYMEPPYKNVVVEDYFPTIAKRKKGNMVTSWNKLKNNETFQKYARIVTNKPNLFSPKKHEQNIVFEETSKEIYLWAVMACKTEVSLIFWERSLNSMFLANLAKYISSGLQKHEKDLKDDYQNQIDTYEGLSYHLLNECYEADQRKATLILSCPHNDFEEMTLLDMAEQANNEKFVQHFVVQKLLTNLWFANIDKETSYITILITCFFPVLAPILLKYRKVDVEKMVLSLNEECDGDFEDGDYGSNSSQVEEVALRPFIPLVVNNQKKKMSVFSGDLSKRPRQSIHAKTKIPVKKNCLVSCTGNYLKKFHVFFQTPVIKFCYHCISHFCLLILFSYILLIQFFPDIQWFEIALTVWIGTIIVEEIRQLINGNTSSLRLLFGDYITDVWNVMDFISIFFYIIGFVLRMIPLQTCTLCFYSGRIMMSLSLLMFCMRVLRFFSIHQNLGPFLVMIQKMLIHIFYFFIIIIVMVLGYGVATTVIKFPNYEASYYLFLDILLAPWFAIQQAFFSEDCKIPSDLTISQTKLPAYTCAVEGKNPNECYGREENCQTNTWLVPIMGAFYILLTNVMMLNLLIAMISDTYTEVSNKTELVWSMQRLKLIQEYHERPSLPPPFILFEHIYMIFRRLCPAKPPTLAERTNLDFSINLPNLVKRNLQEWELLQAESYMRLTQIDGDDNISSKIKDTRKSVESMHLRMNKYATSSILSNDPPTYSLYDLSFSPDFPPPLYQRFAQIEKELEGTEKTIQLLITKFPAKTNARRRTLPFMATLELSGTNLGKQIQKQYMESEKEEMQAEFDKNLQLHNLCRENFCYQNTTGAHIYRFKVSDFHVPFEVDYPEYNPETFTDNVVEQTPNADLDIIKNPLLQLHFNTHEPGLTDRISMMGEYKVVNGLPLNPRGRTGLRGRGLLAKWGPNKINKAIFIRWEDRKTNEGVKRMEFMTKIDNDETDVFTIPERLNPPMLLPVYECLYPLITNILHESGIRWFLNHEKEVYKGYLDDPRNTDNAWLEVDCQCYSVKATPAMGIDKNFEFEFSDTVKFKWKRITSTLQTKGNDLFLLTKAAKIYGGVV